MFIFVVIFCNFCFIESIGMFFSMLVCKVLVDLVKDDFEKFLYLVIIILFRLSDLGCNIIFKILFFGILILDDFIFI